MILLIHHIQIIQNTFTADHLHTDTIMEFHYRKKLHHSNLTCMCHMSSTTCTHINTRESHDTNLSCQFFLTSVINSFQFLSIRISDYNFPILPHSLIYFPLNFCKLRVIQHTIQIYSDHIASHMETYIIITILLMNNTADHMLTGMLLHQVKTPRPVNFSFNLRTHFQSLISIMK